MAKIEIDINDNLWPKLQMVIRATDAFGRVLVADRTEKYDSAYTQFEVTLHNILRPTVDSVIQNRKRGQ